MTEQSVSITINADTGPARREIAEFRRFSQREFDRTSSRFLDLAARRRVAIGRLARTAGAVPSAPSPGSGFGVVDLAKSGKRVLQGRNKGQGLGSILLREALSAMKKLTPFGQAAEVAMIAQDMVAEQKRANEQQRKQTIELIKSFGPSTDRAISSRNEADIPLSELRRRHGRNAEYLNRANRRLADLDAR